MKLGSLQGRLETVEGQLVAQAAQLAVLQARPVPQALAVYARGAPLGVAPERTRKCLRCFNSVHKYPCKGAVNTDEKYPILSCLLATC